MIKPFVDWKQVQDNIDRYDWARHIHSQLADYTHGWMERYADSADNIAGWGHYYFCSECYNKLPFEPDAPCVHYCVSCGHYNAGTDYDEAWNYLYRDEVAKTVFYAGVLYSLNKNNAYVDWIRKVLQFYSSHYESLQVRVPKGFIGKIAGTDLCDAVNIIWLLQGMQLIREELTEEELQEYKEKLFIPEAELLYSHSRSINNIPCWMMCAVAMIGMYFKEEDWVDKAVLSDYGLINQLSKGVTREGFWLEGSFHYHFYCAEPFVYVLQFAEQYGIKLPSISETVLRMYQYPVEIAFRNGRFPNPNDSWPLAAFSAYAGQYEWMNALYDDSCLEHALSISYNGYYVPSFAFGGMCDTHPDGWVQRLLFGKDQYSRLEMGMLPPRCDDHIEFCMLRNKQVELFVKYGFHQRNHSHPDAMNIEICVDEDPVSYDIANAGYGSQLFREWQRKSVAHNTVVIDGRDQEERVRGRVEFFDAASNEARFRADGVYAGVNFIRSLELNGLQLKDTFTVESKQARTMDWVFHCEGELKTDFTAVPCPPLGTEDGYQHLLELRCYETSAAWEVRFELEDKTVVLAMEGEPGTEIYLFKGYEYTAEKIRPGVLVRRKGAGTVFRSAFTFVTGGWQQQ